ncbi:hypothetical protein [Rothia halotolerans]|uniref:hypothetical protein n=1 Tax=Rothia halotolerans TaxID=405770 RepID=UPI00101CA2E8|nr:hypothetical protein [Rothia halotolerans]
MRTLPRALALCLAVLLVLLLALAGILWWRVSAASPELDAQVRAAERLLEVRRAVEDGVVEDPEGTLEDRVEEQLAALSPVARDRAGTPEATDPSRTPAQVFDAAAADLHGIAGDAALAPRQSALMDSIAVGSWLTARDLEGTLAEVPDPASGAGASLGELLGEEPASEELSAGLCPDGAAEDPRSEAVGATLSELYATTWADEVLLARATADGTSAEQEQGVRAAARAHSEQLGQLREALPSGCEGLPEPAAAYSLPREEDPARLGTQEADALAGRSLAILAADDVEPSPAWRTWSLRWLAVHAAMSSEPGAVPALPGDPPGESED